MSTDRPIVGSDLIWPNVDSYLPESLLNSISSRAESADVAGSLDEQSLAELKEANYFGLAVPQAFEGQGAGALRCCAVQRALGRADAGLAIAMNMHLFSIAMMVEHWMQKGDASWLLLEAVATQQRVVASAFAEPSLGGSFLRSQCTAERTTGGYLVSGTKSPCSLAARSDLVCFQAEDPSSAPESLFVALIPTNTAGIRVEQSWDSLGMRASESDTMYLDRCFIPEDLIFHRCEPGQDSDPTFAGGLAWFSLTTTATYLGVVEGALDLGRHALLESKLPHLGMTRAELPSSQSMLGDIYSEVFVIEAACALVARLLDDRTEPLERILPLALALKLAAVEICLKAVSGSAELTGGRSYVRAGGFERYWRDVQAIRFHPPTRPALRRIIGRLSLGLQFSYDLEEPPQVMERHAW